jgi:hypothetical protein
MEEFHNGIWHATNISVCELEVLQDSAGIYSDRVQWISKVRAGVTDTTDESTIAAKTVPYTISLDVKGRLDLPKIEHRSMTQPIQDFHTFFVAISPHLGTTQLKKIGDSILKKDIVKGDFANGINILKGNDCFEVSMKMVAENKKEAKAVVSFLPPRGNCLDHYLDEIKLPVIEADSNNFQMIMASDHGKYNIQYGEETFQINATIRKKDGKILSAAMDNLLRLKLKLNCNAVYTDCHGTFPFTIQRKLKLELLDD